MIKAKPIMVIAFALLCVSCATERQSLLRIEFEDRAKDVVGPQFVCAERKVRSLDNCISHEESVALNLSMHCRHEYEKATEDYARAFLDNDEQRKIFRERRDNIQERIEAFLPFVIENRMYGSIRCRSSIRFLDGGGSIP
jgi:hypothetical protein